MSDGAAVGQEDEVLDDAIDVVIEDSIKAEALGDASEVVELHGFLLSRLGLEVVPGETPEYDAWASVGATVAFFDKATPFIVADWINFGEAQYSERASQAIEATGWSARTVSQYTWVARTIPRPRRVEGLTFFHHRVAAGLPTADDQDAWLKAAKNGDWSVERMRQEIRATRDKAAVRYDVRVPCATVAEVEAIAAVIREAGFTPILPKALALSAKDLAESEGTEK